MRLVLITEKGRKYTVYEGKQAIAAFELENDTLLDAEQVEELRQSKFDEKA